MSFPNACVSTVRERDGESTYEAVLFRYSEAGSLYDGYIVSLPLDVLKHQWSVCTSNRVSLDENGNFAVGGCAVAIWNPSALREIYETGFYGQMVERRFNGKRCFIGLTPLTTKQAQDLLEKEKLVRYGERFLEAREKAQETA